MSPACRAEIPELNEFQREYSDRLVIIGISDENEETVRRIADPTVQYYLALDTQARTKNTVGVAGLPFLMLMDPKGYVRGKVFPLRRGTNSATKCWRT